MIGYVLGILLLIASIACIGIGADQDDSRLMLVAVSGMFSAAFYILLGQVVTLLQRLNARMDAMLNVTPGPALSAETREVERQPPQAPAEDGVRWTVVSVDHRSKRREFTVSAHTQAEAKAIVEGQGFKVLSVTVAG